MNPVNNPYSPGAGTQPPELAGRDELREKVSIATQRIKLRKGSKSIIMVGLRGVGKTVLLDKMKSDAEQNGIYTIRIEAPEGRSLPSMLAPQLRQVLLKLSNVEQAKDLTKHALRALRGFMNAFKVTYGDYGAGFDIQPEPGLADNGDLEHDLQALLETIGEAAAAAQTAIVMFVDELQYVKEEELAALITALHRMAQKALPVMLVGAGLPQLRGRMGNAKSYSERLFDFPVVDALSTIAAKQAIEKPATDEGVVIHQDALDLIVQQTKGYPYFLQEWGKHTWDAASGSPITIQDVRVAAQTVIAALDESFFMVRFDRLTPLEKRYLRGMATLGKGPQRSGDIAEQLGRTVQDLAPTRNSLINKKGMVWSPGHGDNEFTVPLFDEFMKRIMPDQASLDD